MHFERWNGGILTGSLWGNSIKHGDLDVLEPTSALKRSERRFLDSRLGGAAAAAGGGDSVVIP